MQASEAAQWRKRGAMVLAGSIPAFVASGGLNAVAHFKDDLAEISGFVRLGRGADKAKLAVLRVEGARGAVVASAAHNGAPRSATPPRNTGVNEGRQWVLGSGL